MTGTGVMKVGFIGAGRMGAPMVDRLAAAGHDVTVFVRRPEGRARFEGQGLRCAATLPEVAADADVVFVVVLNDEDVRSVCLGAAGVLGAMRAGSTLVQHTTCAPTTVELVADEATPRGVLVLDAALSGSTADISAGKLTLWVGGDNAVLSKLAPVLETYASPIMFVGRIGNGQRVKLINNGLFVSHVGLAVEAVRVAATLGIDERAILASVQQGSGASYGLSLVASLGSVDAVGDRLGDLMLKDVTVLRQTVKRENTDLGVIGAILSSDVVERQVLRSGTTAGEGR